VPTITPQARDLAPRLVQPGPKPNDSESDDHKADDGSPYFIDLFAGCGGLSLGLLNAGWKGHFAIEKHPDAFNTFLANLINGHRNFDWPSWLPKQAVSTSTLLKEYTEELRRCRGKIALIAGGPPCQGFSLAGRRIHSDPRNSLSDDYLTIVDLVRPRFLVIENVQGFDLPFRKHGVGPERERAHSEVIAARLRSLGYEAYGGLVDLHRFGVPQRRKRYILIAVRRGELILKDFKSTHPLRLLGATAPNFLMSKGLKSSAPFTARQAIRDLEVAGKILTQSTDSGMSGFKEAEYRPVKNASGLIRLLREEADGPPSSVRLPNHRPETIAHFRKIQNTCRPGKCINDEDRRRLKTRKHAITPLVASQVSATVTTLPDDLIHYSEPRVLTVREHARLQTFPDWFTFMGKYTTGGMSRRQDCPRYSQVGNAVPPLFAEALGRFLLEICRPGKPR
jgi:DNA (cytosine-5)-methyltransferase 1